METLAGHVEWGWLGQLMAVTVITGFPVLIGTIFKFGMSLSRELGVLKNELGNITEKVRAGEAWQAEHHRWSLQEADRLHNKINREREDRLRAAAKLADAEDAEGLRG